MRRGQFSLRSVLLRSQVQPPDLLNYTLLVYHLHQLPHGKDTLKDLLILCCSFVPVWARSKSRGPQGGVSVCCWCSRHFQRVSTSSHHQAGKKGFQHFQNARDYSQIRRCCLCACRILCLRFFSWKGLSIAHSKENT